MCLDFTTPYATSRQAFKIITPYTPDTLEERIKLCRHSTFQVLQEITTGQNGVVWFLSCPRLTAVAGRWCWHSFKSLLCKNKALEAMSTLTQKWPLWPLINVSLHYHLQKLYAIPCYSGQDWFELVFNIACSHLLVESQMNSTSWSSFVYTEDKGSWAKILSFPSCSTLSFRTTVTVSSS